MPSTWTVISAWRSAIDAATLYPSDWTVEDRRSRPIISRQDRVRRANSQACRAAILFAHGQFRADAFAALDRDVVKQRVGGVV
jgi:hypothetical protein